MNWPEHILPLPSQDYGANSDPRLARTEFEVGFRQRRRFTAVEDVLNVSWMLDQLQMDIFEAVLIDDLEQGSEPVDMTILGLGGPLRQTVRFIGGSYSRQVLSGSFYRVQAQLRVEPRATADPGLMEWLLYLEDGTPEGWLELCTVLHTYLHTCWGQSELSEYVTEYLETH